MENIIVGVIVAVALAFSLRSFIRIFKGDGGCACSASCSCSPEKKECCGQGDSPFIRRP